MKILIVSPFPPLRDGVGKYAAQEVEALRKQGHDVEVLAPVPCAAHYVEDLKGGLKLLKVRRYAKRYDRVILQYQPSHFHKKGGGISRLLTSLGMMMLFRRTPNLEVVCHEVEYPQRRHWTGKLHPYSFFERQAWDGPSLVYFHTAREVEALRDKLGASPKRVELRDHGKYFHPATRESPLQARRRLGLSPDYYIFLCIGFIQPHKGFDRAAEAFQRVASEDARLVIIGSVRTELPEHRDYVRSLHLMAASDPRLRVSEVALSDEEFDRWIIASDVVVLPYRASWSSGVAERAKLFKRKLIVSSVGGLAEQTDEGDIVFETDDDLGEAMNRLTGGGDASRRVEQVMSAAEAQEIVREEGRRLRSVISGEAVTDAGPSSVGEAMQRMTMHSGVQTAVVPSSRPVIGPLLTIIKKVVRRLVGWYVEPLVATINEFQIATLRALTSLASEVEALQHRVESLEEKVATEQDRTSGIQ